jgi:hypothetical protein
VKPLNLRMFERLPFPCLLQRICGRKAFSEFRVFCVFRGEDVLSPSVGFSRCLWVLLRETTRVGPGFYGYKFRS